MISASHSHKTGSAATNTMRRNIELYINGSRVDLDAEALILFNYRFEELSNPTIVKNSYSQNITLKSTDTNNRVFGAFFRSDRMVTGALFDPKRKVPFQILSDGTLLEAGYAKLENVVTKNGVAHEYKVGLYGGLGSFFYALSYDDNGNKKTLASLDFGRDLGFTINASTVKTAWDALRIGPYAGTSKWDIINFAPCYNGIPTDDFDADKMIVRADETGLPETVISGDDTYRTYQNATLVKLGRKVNEWEAHDLRSYLQRAVLRFRAVLEAISDPNQNGGFTVDLDSTFFDDDNPYFNDLWITLPQIHKLNGLSEGDSGVFSFPGGGGDIRLNSAVELGIPFGTEVTAQVGVKITMSPAQDPAGDYLYGSAKDGTTVMSYCWLLQVVGYDSNGAAVAGSSVELLQTDIEGKHYFAQWVAQEIGYRPAFNAGYDVLNMAGQWNKTGAGMEWSKTFTAAMKAPNLSRLELVAIPVLITDVEASNRPVVFEVNNTAYAFEDQEDAPGSRTRVEWIGVEGVAGANTYQYDAASSVRSNSKITQEALLATEHTPAEYLLAFAKVFGLQFMVDREAKTVTIMTRDTFFSAYADDIIDLTDRVDRSKDITVSPFLFDTKWLELAFEADEIQFAEEYLNAYGRKYGAARINTGFEFNSETKELLDGIAATGGVEVMERSKMYNNVTEGGYSVPSAFLDSGEFTLYKDGVPGDDKSFPLPIPTSRAQIDYWNDIYLGYDCYSKPQFHGTDQKELELRDTFLLCGGKVYRDPKYYGHVFLTDDDEYMSALNDNTPCWHGGPYGVSFNVENYPLFGRYTWAGALIVRSLDFSMPAELDIPGVGFKLDAGIYERYWARFLAGRYDDDARVMKCSVDLSGLQVDAELLRRFYYYDGAIWSLNAIENHSVTTFDPTKCEFVKVIDIQDYTNGQESGGDTITANPASIVLDPYGGSAVISVNASGAWTAQVIDLTGVTLSANSGSGPAQITVTAPANQGTALAGRIVFTLTATGDTAEVQASQPIPGEQGVTPASLEFAPPGQLIGSDGWTVLSGGEIYGRYDLAVTTDGSWKVTGVPAWVRLYVDGVELQAGTVKNGSATVRAVANENYSQTARNGFITFEFTRGGVTSSQSVEVTQGGDAWSVLQVTPAAGMTVDTETATVNNQTGTRVNIRESQRAAANSFFTYRWSSNTDPELFIGMQITGYQLLNRTIAYPVMDITRTERAVDDGGYVTGTVKISEYLVAASWGIEIHPSAWSGAGRVSKYALVDGAWVSFMETMIHPAPGITLPYIILSEREVTIGPNAYVTVDVTSNSFWIGCQSELYDSRQLVQNGAISAVQSGSGNENAVEVRPSLNNTGATRDLKYVFFTGDAEVGLFQSEIKGGVLTSLLIHQEPYQWSIPSSLTYSAAAGSWEGSDRRMVEVASNVQGYAAYSGLSSAVWCRVSPETGSATTVGAVYIDLDANTTGAPRSCIVTVHSNIDNNDKTITIIQEA